MTRTAAVRRWLAVLLVAGIAFSPLAGSSFFEVTFDDDAFIIENPLIRELSWSSARSWFGGFYHADYVPVTLATFAVDYQLWGSWAGGYHLTNIALHLAAATLVFVLVGALGGGREVGLLAGALFALHPLQLETVAIISQRKTLLAGIFALLALLAYHRFAERRRAPSYALALICFALGGLAKSSVVALPLLLLLLDWRAGRRLRLGDKIPFFLVAAAIAGISVMSKADLGVVKAAHGGSPIATAMLMGRVWLEYLAAFLVPARLSAAYYYRPSMAFSYWHGLALAAVIGMHAFLWLRRARFPHAAFALFWFTAAMLPVANLVPIAVVRADRYVYLAMVGLVWWAAAVLSGLGRRWGDSAGARQVPLFAVTSVLAVFTLTGTAHWRDDVTIWQRVVEIHPWNSRARFLLGRAYTNRGSERDAMETLRQAARLDPTFAAPHRDLAQLHLRAGEIEQARRELSRAQEIAPDEPIPEGLRLLLKPESNG